MAEEPRSALVCGGKLPRISAIVNITHSPTPVVVLNLLQFVHSLQDFHLLVLPALSRFILIVTAGNDKPGHRCPGRSDDTHSPAAEVLEDLVVRQCCPNRSGASFKLFDQPLKIGIAPIDIEIRIFLDPAAIHRPTAESYS